MLSSDDSTHIKQLPNTIIHNYPVKTIVAYSAKVVTSKSQP